MKPSFANGLQGRFGSAEFRLPSHGSSRMYDYALLPRCGLTHSNCHWILVPTCLSLGSCKMAMCAVAIVTLPRYCGCVLE